MDGAPQSYYDRLEAGIGFRWRELPGRLFKAEEIDPDASVVQLHRQGRSHRGIGQRRAIRTLFAYEVDQAFLDELCELDDLECLYMRGVRAADLRPLERLGKLQRLVINSATRIEDFAWVEGLSQALRALAIEHAPKVSQLDPLAGLTQLGALAVEGSLQSRMKVESLAPLAGLEGLHFLFLTALQTQDRKLEALSGLQHLKVLEFANYYADGEVERLAACLPRARCRWFEKLRGPG